MAPTTDLLPGSIQQHIHVVLVEPGDSLNVGAVARAMSNLGFANLHLVAPPRYDADRAAISACWATPLLAQARVHADLSGALADMQHVVGFAAREGRHRPQQLLLHEWAGRMADLPPARTALLFGPEDHGLTQEHLSHCQWLVRIPSAAENPSFNLAQAVLLALYELTRRDWPAAAEPVRDLPPVQELSQLERLVGEVLRRCGFYYGGTPRPIPDTVNHLLRRIVPDRRELPVLMGMFGKINRALQGRVPIQSLPEDTKGTGAESAGEPAKRHSG